MKNKVFFFIFVAVLFAVASIGFFASPSTTIVAQDDDTLVSMFVEEGATLDGIADEAFWEEAVPIEVGVRRGANNGSTDVMMKSVYTEDSVYFLVVWEDPTFSFERFPWEMQEDGTWIQLRDPENMGGDENVWYEDKFAFIWEINEIEILGR